MRTTRDRITFVGFQLGDYGGLETRITAAVDLAEREGYDVSVRTARPTAADSITAVRLDDKDHRSVIGDWQRRPAVKGALAAGRLVGCVRRRRLLTAAERQSVGHRWAMSQIEQYWDGTGRELLERTDVLHLFGPPLPFLVAAMQAAKAAGVPAIYQSVHAVTADYAADRWRNGFVGACNDLDLILVSYGSQADDFRRHFDYRGEFVEIGQWAYDDEDELLAVGPRPVNDHRTTIGALCRLDRVKGLDLLLRAVASLSDEHVLRIGGDGPEEKALRALSEELGIADRVEFVGYVADRVAFYRDVDLFVIASRAEGGPVTGVEAMAAGLPIVSTAVGAMPDRLAGGVGLVVPVEDVQALADGIRQVSEPRAHREAVGTAARECYLRRYSASTQARRLADTWAELAARRVAGIGRSNP